MSWTDSQIKSLITFYSSVLVSGTRNFATGMKNRRQKPTPVFWRRFLAPVSGACVMSIRCGCRSPTGRGNFRGFSRPFKSIGNLRCSRRCRVRCKRIIHSLITSCSRRDHSVCQASANGNLEKFGLRRCGLSTGKGFKGRGVGNAQRGRSLIFTTPLFIVELIQN